MRRGSHRYQRGRTRSRWPFVVGIVVALAVAGTAVWYLALQEGSPIGEDDGGLTDFSFRFGKVGGTTVAERAPEEVLGRAAQSVRRTLNAMYIAGFVDPSKWQGGTHPEVLEAFDEDTRRRARRDIELLALAGDAPHFERIDRADGRLSVRFLVDEDQQPTAAVVTTNFTAEGQLTSGGPAFAGQFATYHMRPDGRRWVIIGYDAHVQTGAGRLPASQRTPQAGPTTEATGG